MHSELEVRVFYDLDRFKPGIAKLPNQRRLSEDTHVQGGSRPAMEQFVYYRL